MNNLAINLRLLREKRKMTQSEVSQKLNLGERVLSHYENGKREPDYDLLLAIADFYGVSVDYLLRENSDTTEYKNNLEKLEETYLRKQLPDVIETSELWKRYQANCEKSKQEWLEHQDDEEWVWRYYEEGEILNEIAMQEADEKAMSGNLSDAYDDYEKLLLSGNAYALRPLFSIMEQIDEIFDDSNGYMCELEWLVKEMEYIEKKFIYCAIARKSISEKIQSEYDILI